MHKLLVFGIWDLGFGISAKNTNYNLGFGISAFGISAFGFRIWAAGIFHTTSVNLCAVELCPLCRAKQFEGSGTILEKERTGKQNLYRRNATRDIRKQGHLLRKIINEKLEKRSVSQVEEEGSPIKSTNHMANITLYTQENNVLERLTRQEDQIKPQKAFGGKEQLSELDDNYNLIDQEII
ncbi:hypothetical protein Glove_35g9 [Diversispora epigaea]|uniref:Uncharacterized protein n=1 Tax=Diversispora epigaea TaxID=1348612 RepID=A0A397JH98_9GLOM|nr:hypothetical protein Glove_35g9 [Diversispora epigaea]